MTKKEDGHPAQGEALPEIRSAGLSDNVQQGTILSVDGLDTHQHGWWTRHPQAADELRTIRTISPISGTLPGIYPFLGAWAGSQRKRPHCACLARRGLAATQSTIAFLSYGIFLMIYTFLIASHGRVADMRRIRTISAVADTEQQARNRLAGLPLVFVSRTPTGRAKA